MSNGDRSMPLDTKRKRSPKLKTSEPFSHSSLNIAPIPANSRRKWKMSHVGNLRRQINLRDATIHVTVRRPDWRTMHKMSSYLERQGGSPLMKQGPKIAA